MRPNNNNSGQGQQASVAQQMLQAMQRMLVVNQRLFDVSQRIHDHLTKTSPGQMDDLNAPTDPTQGGSGSRVSSGSQTAAVQPDYVGAGMNGLQQVMRQLPMFGNVIANFMQALRAAAGQMGQAVQMLRDSGSGGANPGARGGSPTVVQYSPGMPPPDRGAGGVQSGAGLLGNIAPAAAAVATGLGAVAVVAGAAHGALQQMTGTAVSFVQTLNPGLVMQYNLALRDFSATVGQALTPIVEAATAITKTFGAVLGPVMESLKPVVESVAQVFVNLSGSFAEVFARIAQTMQPIIAAVVSVVQAMEPFIRVIGQTVGVIVSALSPTIAILAGIIEGVAGAFKLIGDALSIFSPILNVFSAIMAGVGATIKAIFDGLQILFAPITSAVKWIIDVVKNAMMSFAQSALAVAVRLASLIPFFGKSITDAILNNFAPEKKDITGKAVPQNATVGDIGGLLQTMTRAALLAGPGGAMKPVDPMEAWRQETLAMLKKIAGKVESVDFEAAFTKALEASKKSGRPVHEEMGYTSREELEREMKKKMKRR